MTLTLDLPLELEERLTAEAARLGIPVAAYILHVLEEAEEGAPPQPSTGAELVAYWEREGVIGLWSDRTDIQDSSEYARQLRRQAETRTHE